VSPGRASGGFALLVTITLLAFVVLLLVGLATYTRIETAISGNTQKLAQARQNALLALDVAVAQLQKNAGPDRMVTATAELLNVEGANYYTGAWTSFSSTRDPQALLVSGSENSDATIQKLLDAALNPSTAAIGNQVFLVGNNSIAKDPLNPTAEELRRRVKLATQPITTFGVPGVAATTPAPTIGRYAWWVGDQGVKADVARADLTAQLNYAPFVDSSGVAVNEMRTRLFQETGLGAGAFNTSSKTVAFDPRDPANLTLAANAVAAQQILFLKNSAGAALDPSLLRAHYHNWTVGNHAVLARTNAAAGEPALRNDLSLNPAALGAAFTAWSNYPAYMESPEANPLAAALTQPANALRRRYRMTPPVTDANGSQFGVAPVLSYVALAFSLRNNSEKVSELTNLDCAVRCVVGLWNPYTSALVPETAGLQLFVTGLPIVRVRDSGGSSIRVDLQEKLGDFDPATKEKPLKFLLPWPVSSLNDDRASWLPGRVYNWSLPASSVDPSDGKGNSMNFSERDLTTGTGMVRNVTTETLIRSTTTAPIMRSVVSDSSVPRKLKFELRRVSDGVVLASFEPPSFREIASDLSNDTDIKFNDFAFVFRLRDPAVDGVPWLQTDGADPRRNALSEVAYQLPGKAEEPGEVVRFISGKSGVDLPGGATNPTLLLDRYPGTAAAPAGLDFNEDIPVFELPRSPLLSVGQLQHLCLPAQRPFWIGGSAAASGPVVWSNALFDRHFFSGHGFGSAWSDITRPLPNFLARVLRHKPDGAPVIAADFTDDGLSAKHLLQGGAFNLNSTDPDAWAAVLRSVRFPDGRAFTYLNADPASGTNADTATAALTAEAAFPRFAQSAQETYKTTSDYAQSEPFPSSTPTVLPTELYRQGFRTLDATSVTGVTALAQTISAAVKARLAASGPFLSIEEFLNPSAGPGTSSLLETVISTLKLNTSADFNSSTLTQSDVLTALAPVLFVRSDTFTVRTYGEAVNPATGTTEGRAWCEAVVQRFPEPFDPAVARQPTDGEYRNPPGAYGRRFKIVSFRWLTRSDI
jgi:hypothetical protein